MFGEAVWDCRLDIVQDIHPKSPETEIDSMKLHVYAHANLYTLDKIYYWGSSTVWLASTLNSLVPPWSFAGHFVLTQATRSWAMLKIPLFRCVYALKTPLASKWMDQRSEVKHWRKHCLPEILSWCKTRTLITHNQSGRLKFLSNYPSFLIPLLELSFPPSYLNTYPPI